IDPYFFIKREVPVAEEKRRAELRTKDGPYDDLWRLEKVEQTAKSDNATDDEKPRERLPEKEQVFFRQPFAWLLVVGGVVGLRCLLDFLEAPKIVVWPVFRSQLGASLLFRHRHLALDKEIRID